MKTVYTAQNSVDAHVIRGLLESHGFNAIVTGDYLQGGIGQLPAFGVVEVKVPGEDVAQARQVIRKYLDDGEPEGELEA